MMQQIPVREFKHCTVCGHWKRLKEFIKRPDRKLGVDSDCMECRKKAKSQIVVCGRSNRSLYRIKEVYGLTREEYKVLYKKQKGMCLICLRPEPKIKLNVDHCHEIGNVRGLLCNNCNTGLGFLGDSIENLQRGIKYLRKNKKC